MSKKYGRQIFKTTSKPTTNPPEGFVEVFMDSDNGGNPTLLLPTGESSAIGSGGTGGTVAYSDTDPLVDGTASQGISDKVSRQDHVHPSDASKASVSHTHTGTYEPANANIQTHVASTANPHSTTAAQVGAAAASHTHGNVSNTGAIGTTANLPVITGTSGVVSVGAWYESVPAAATNLGAVGTSASPSRGDHSHPSRIALTAPAAPVNGDIWIV